MNNKIKIFLFGATLFSLSFSKVMSYKIFVIKLGGSIITKKEKKYGSAKINIISNIAHEIATFLSKNPNHRLIIVNGGGSFAHPIAKKYELDKKIDKGKIRGITECHSGVIKINSIIVNQLVNEGVQAIPVSPMSCIKCSDGKITCMNTKIIQTMLDYNFVPVLHGDIVIDETTRMTILSGDQIASRIGKKLSATAVGLASIEDGVYDKSGNIIPEISHKNFDQFKQSIGGSKCIDATGGMFGKVAELLTPSAPKISYIFNGTKKGNILKFLEGAELGTKIINVKSDPKI